MSRPVRVKFVEPDLWRGYRDALDEYEQALRELLLSPWLPRPYGLPSQSLTVTEIETLLHIDEKSHGYALIQPAGLPVVPRIPPQPPAVPLWRRIFWPPPKT